ncbi:MAG: cache domain-containing protein [Dehalococcoidia bacterium]|nr:cache domain-containing protein [Dehalococcoidia bacterium]
MADFPGRLTEDNFRPIALYYIGPSGALRYYPATGEMQRTATGLSSAISGDLSEVVGPGGNSERATIWTTPYRDETRKGLVVTAYTPVYVANEYRGAIGVDLSIERLIDQTNMVRPTPTGFAFYVDDGGQVLETLAYDLVTMARADPNNTAFHQVIEEMLAGQSDVARVRLGSREMFVAYAPLAMSAGASPWPRPSTKSPARPPASPPPSTMKPIAPSASSSSPCSSSSSLPSVVPHGLTAASSFSPSMRWSAAPGPSPPATSTPPSPSAPTMNSATLRHRSTG